MPCPCGNTSCPCGIPCYCLEELCKCPECAIALHPFCKICNKPLITDLQKDKGTCSCFVGESTDSILENGDNQQYKTGNTHVHVGNFVNGRFIANVIPVLPFPQFLPQQPTCLRPPSSTMQTDYKNILPSFISDKDAAIPSSRDSGILSTAELYPLEKYSKEPNYTGICSTDYQNTDISCKETCPLLVFPSTDENKIANVAQNIKSETEESAIVQETSFCLSSVGVGNISHPIWLEDPVWRPANPAFCVAGSPDSNLKLCNPFYVAGPVHTIQKKCCQQVSNLNFDSNGLAPKDSATILKMNEQEPLDSTERGKPDLETHGQSEEFEASQAFVAEIEFGVFSLSGDFKATSLMEPSNEISEDLMPDKKLTAFSTDISCSGEHDLSDVQIQQVNAVSTFSSRMNDCIQNYSVDHNAATSVSSREERLWSYLEAYAKQFIPEYFVAFFQRLINMRSNQRFEGNVYPQSVNPSSAFVNNQRDEEIDSIPLYIDASTTRKMGELLKLSKH